MSGESPGAAPAVSRPLRADAARNRTRILDAAREAFAESGLDVGVEEIARRAGVGKGTLYRRFPTKEVLVQAIVEDRVQELEEISARCTQIPDAGEGFARFLSEAARMQASDQGFLDVVARRMGEILSPDQHGRLLALLAGPLLRAQASGQVRADLVVDDVPLLLRMLGATARPGPAGPGGADWERYLRLLLEGLRASG
jgi:AcrR family transcriptional regulator